jgi:hypothetical protein
MAEYRFRNHALALQKDWRGLIVSTRSTAQQ